MTDAQLGWIAGIMDGEGSIGLARIKQGDYWHYHTHTKVSNTFYEMLTELQFLTELGIIGPERNERRRKSSWAWQLRNNEQRIFLPMILPHLIVKHRQAELVLEYLALPVGTSNAPVDYDTAMTRDHIFQALAELNRRGF